MFSIPSTEVYGRESFLELYNFFFIIEDSVPWIKDDLPLPETPVTQTMQPSGIEQLTLDKLFPFASIKLIVLPLPSLLNDGTGTSNSLLRNLDVKDFWFKKAFGSPWATITPPSEPGPGPTSIILSALWANK